MVISQKKAVKKKLMAAASMLLIACVMLISSSYAWFTLSTAPEVTGITTTVGANGNLEIALATGGIKDASGETIVEATWPSGSNVQSNVGDSVLDIEQKNVTWGNLIDVSDTSIYGMDKMVLMPSELNVLTGGTHVDTGSMLKTPSYGNDGRIVDLYANTAYATYDKVAQSFPTAVNAYGVRAIGTALDMTPRQLSYRTATGAVKNTSTLATLNAATSLNDNGSALATMIVTYATDKTTKFTKDDLNTVAAVIEDLEAASLNINNAMEQSIIGAVASKAAETADIDATEFAAIEAVIKAGNYSVSGSTITLTSTSDLPTTITSYDMPAEWGAIYAKATKMTDDLVDAKELNSQLLAAHSSAANTEQVIPWSESADGNSDGVIGGLREVLAYIVNPDKVTINGILAENVMDNVNQLVNDTTGGKGINVLMPTGSGVYADIADFCGNYSASIIIEKMEYGSLELKDFPAKMSTETSVKPSYISQTSTMLTTLEAPSSTSNTAATVTDFYGYAIDLFFRTNVDGSDLLLEQDATQRVYSDSTNTETLGGGSYMEFESTTNGFTTDEVRELMSAIRVVFLDKDGKILGKAKLDTRTEDIDPSETIVDKPTEIVGSKVKSQLKLYEVVTTTTGEGESAVTTTTEQFKEDQSLTALPKNTATGVTAVVYLDGNYVTNAMVANATSSMKGSMNLQFTSSAELEPMVNKPLKEGSGNTGVTETPSGEGE